MIDPQWILIYISLGIIVGFFAGLLGIGGGAIMVPALTTLFILQGFSPEYIVHLALGTSMAAIVITSISSMKAHHTHNAVLWPVVISFSPGIIVGAFGATFLATQISSRDLAIFFATYMAYVAMQMVLNIKPKPTRQLPHNFFLSVIGVVIGGISALVAIGGGTMTVPFMTWCNIKINKAIGTSAAIGLPIAIAGSIGYITNGWNIESLPPYTYGYIYLPAVILISTTSYFTAPLGAKATHKLPIPILKKIFALFLVILSLKMVYSILSMP